MIYSNHHFCSLTEYVSCFLFNGPYGRISNKMMMIMMMTYKPSDVVF